MSETVFTNEHPETRKPILSIVTPFHKNDPTPLVKSLQQQSAALNLELILVDDGSGIAELTRTVEALVLAFPCPATLITLHVNQGRSGARNRLMAEAKAPYVLFLDSDMLPDSDAFVNDWLALIKRTKPVIAYGGFSTLQVSKAPEFRLAKVVAERTDCQNARQRLLRGATAVATSNLLVRADVFKKVPFDAGFSGWGWEDVDWALRASEAGFAIAHVDIPATHLGLDHADVLMEKFAKAGPNFRRILERHPKMNDLPGTKLARLLSKLPFQGMLRKVVRSIALQEALPLAVREKSIRVWRALWAADALSSQN